MDQDHPTGRFVVIELSELRQMLEQLKEAEAVLEQARRAALNVRMTRARLQAKLDEAERTPLIPPPRKLLR